MPYDQDTTTPGAGAGAEEAPASGGPGAEEAPAPRTPAPEAPAAEPTPSEEPPKPEGDPLGDEAIPARPDGEPGDESASEDHAPAVAKELAEATAQRDAYLALAQRSQADFENYRKRAVKDVRAAEERGMGKLARELLPALDNLHLALDRSGDDAGPLVEGVRLVLGELMAALARAGIEAYSPRGESFDPQVHEAVGQRPPIDGEQPGTVVEVMQQGYRHGAIVLRPARVFVAG